jgi:hypothetical protein
MRAHCSAPSENAGFWGDGRVLLKPAVSDGAGLCAFAILRCLGMTKSNRLRQCDPKYIGGRYARVLRL